MRARGGKGLRIDGRVHTDNGDCILFSFTISYLYKNSIQQTRAPVTSSVRKHAIFHHHFRTATRDDQHSVTHSTMTVSIRSIQDEGLMGITYKGKGGHGQHEGGGSWVKTKEVQFTVKLFYPYTFSVSPSPLSQLKTSNS